MTPESQLAGFIAKYTPEIGELAEEVLTKMRERLPGAFELAYDNYNALAIGFSPTERTSDAIFSVTLYPRWVSLFLLQAAHLSDPDILLQGQGKIARHIVLNDASDLEKPAIQLLIADALTCAGQQIDETNPAQLIIKSVSAKQRPRTPVVLPAH